MTDLFKLKLMGFFRGGVFFVPILALFFTDRGVGLDQLIYTQVFYSTAMVLFEMPTGVLADKLGQKISLALGQLSAALAQFTMIFFPNIFGLYIAYFFRGLGGSFVSGSDEAVIYEVSEKGEFQKNFSSYKSSWKLGMLSSSLVVAVLLSMFSEQAYIPAFVLTGASMLVSSFIALTLKHNPKKQSNNDEMIFEGSGMVSYLKEGLKIIGRHKTSLIPVIIFTGLLMNAQHVTKGVYQPYFVESGAPLFWIGGVITFGSLLNMFTFKYAYILKNHFNLRQILAIVFFPISLIYIFMGASANPILLILAYIILQGLFDVEKISVSEYINKHTPSKVRSTVLSTASFSSQTIVTILKLALGVVTGILGVGGYFTTLGIFLLVVLVLSQVVFRKFNIR